MVVEIGDGHLRIALAHGRHQLRRGQRATAERVEVGLRPVDRRGEDIAPQPGQPPHGAAEIGLLLGAFARGRPGQRVAVDLARRAGGQLVDEHQPRHQRGGQRLGQRGAGLDEVERGSALAT